MKKKIISAITAVLMSILALAVFAACGEDDATAIKHAVTFMDGETVVSTVEVEDGTALTDAQIPAAPQHTGGGVFEGWYIGETKVEAGYKPTADVTATAKYHTDDTPATYTVTFKDGESTVKTVTVEEGTKLTAGQIPADPDHAGQVFDGWFVGETKIEAGYEPTADVTATAKYHTDDTPATYTVEYFSGVASGTGITGTAPATETVEAGQSVTLPANPWKREGYLFTGYDIQHYVEVKYTSPFGSSSQTSWEWQNIEGETGKQQGYTYTPHENIRITARWTDSTITVKYDPNGGSGTIANGSGTWSKSITLTTEAFTAPQGKSFAGWALTQTGPALETQELSGTVRILFNNVKDSLVLLDDGNYELTLYALWEERVEISEIAGVWSYNGKQAIISQVTAGDESRSAVGSVIIDNEYILLYRQKSNQFAGCTKYSYEDIIVITWSNDQLDIDGNIYTGKTDISDAQKSDFIGKWQRTSSTQIWNIEESKATLSLNGGTEASVYVIIDKYLVLEYVQNDYYAYQFLLTKDETGLTGYFTEPDKMPVATSFTLITESGGGGDDGGGDEDLPAGDLYTATTKMEYVDTLRGGKSSFSVDKLVIDIANKKLYLWGTYGKTAEPLVAKEVKLTASNAAWFEGEGDTPDSYWTFSVDGNVDFNIAVWNSGECRFANGDDAQIGTNCYTKQA